MIRSGKSDGAIYQPHGESRIATDREHYAFIADLYSSLIFFLTLPSFMAGIYSSAHTRTSCYSPQIRARSIRSAPEFSS
jgi:hypothetical protein